MLSKLGVEPCTVLLVIAGVYNVGWDVLDGDDRFTYSCNAGVIINICASTTMSRRLPDFSEERVGSDDV